MAALTGHCDCGAVTITVPSAPEEINACPCDYCRRAGAHWGYYKAGSATITGKTATYRRAAKVADFHRCPTCGIVTHWDGNDVTPHMGVNMANFEQAALAGIPVVEDP
ncbi:GFA family protein [Pseudoroseicyclus sp. H15]